MISRKQEKLDEIKWYIGNEIGCDPCGTFEYCSKCDKSEENPCENALNRFKESKRQKSKSKQSKIKIGNSDFRATVVDKK